MSSDFGIFRAIVISHLEAELFILILVHVFKMTAQNSTLREHLGAEFALIWFMASVLSEMDMHIAAFSESASTTIPQALECSLEPVSCRVHDSDGLAHRFGDGLEAFLTTQFLSIIIRKLFSDIGNFLIFIHGGLLCDVIESLILWGENGCICIDLFFIRNFSCTVTIIGICKLLYDRDNIAH